VSVIELAVFSPIFAIAVLGSRRRYR